MDANYLAKYHADVAQYFLGRTCPHCEQLDGCAPWCILRNQLVQYARIAVLDGREISTEDEIMLHGLGVLWGSGSARKEL
jgi:hypothetical protein